MVLQSYMKYKQMCMRRVHYVIKTRISKQFQFIETYEYVKRFLLVIYMKLPDIDLTDSNDITNKILQKEREVRLKLISVSHRGHKNIVKIQSLNCFIA